MKVAIKQWYVDFLEKRNNPFESVLYFLFLLLSYVYGAIVEVRNFLYNTGICRSFSVSRKVISVGNISWAGSGKTTLVTYLYHKLSSGRRVAILRRGYGEDEGKLLKEKNVPAYAGRDRVRCARALTNDFDLFILDDGFQYRALKRDLDCVVMAAREWRADQHLIPASFFREPLHSLTRADILLLNYKEEIPDAQGLRERIQKKFPHLKIFFSRYRIARICDLDNATVSLDVLKNKKCAAFTAIGYPKGFLNKLKEAGVETSRAFVFPDHHELTKDEFTRMQDTLVKEGITELIVTHKDKFHLPAFEKKIHVVILEIEMEIENETEFLDTIHKKISMKS